MKKNIALIISILALIFFILFFRIDLKKEANLPLNLAGTLINNGIYSYDLNSSSDKLFGMSIKKNNLYYLTYDNKEFTLNKLNFYTNEINPISKQTLKDNTCNLDNININCFTKNSFTSYDLSFKEQYNFKSDSNYEPYLTLIPYKDTYLIYNNNSLNIIINDQEQPYFSIDTTSNLYFIDYYANDSNTYILLSTIDNNYYICNINEKEIQEINKENYFKYKNGFVFYDLDYFTIYNLDKNTIQTYSNPLNKNYFYTSTYNEENNTIYLYDVLTNKIYILDFTNEIINEIDTNTFTKYNPISKLIIEDNYLCASINQDINNFYILDLQQIKYNTKTYKEYENELNNNIVMNINDIKKDYNVNIKIKDDAIIKFPDFSAKELSDNKIISEALLKITSILSKYDKTFFSSFYNLGYNGLNIYLTGTLTPSNYETQVSNPAAYSLIYNDEYMIVIDINQSNIEELLCHELLHNLEFNLNSNNIDAFYNWQTYNPSNFYYNNSYTKDYNFNYTIEEDSINNVYFVDYYSQTYPAEDRARVFEKICSCSSNSIINEYPNLYAKGLYLKEEIIKYYPSLKSSNLFSSLN